MCYRLNDLSFVNMIASGDPSTRHKQDFYYIELTFLVGMLNLRSRLENQWQE